MDNIKTRNYRISIGVYSSSRGLVAERVIASFDTEPEGLKYLREHSDRPIYLWKTCKEDAEDPWRNVIAVSTLYIVERHKMEDDCLQNERG